MPIHYDDTCAVFEDDCAAEEAEALLDWLRSQADATVDLTRCVHLHTAVFQVVIATTPRIIAPPKDQFLADCLAASMPIKK